VKIKIELTDDGQEEIVIRCRALDERVRRMTAWLEAETTGKNELKLYLDNVEYFVAPEEILYFESSSNRVYAHTENSVYVAPHKLFELEALLAPAFIRSSKSSLVNLYRIRSLRRELAGHGEITFRDSDKRTYFSRGYYKPLHEKITEMRLMI